MCKRVLIGTVILCSFALFLVASGTESEKVLSRQKRKLVFPQFTSMTLAMALVSQISYVPSHKVAVNTGFFVAYAVPFNTSNFWSPVYWARSLLLSDSSSVLANYFHRLAESGASFTLMDNNDIEEEKEEIEAKTEEIETTEAVEETTTTKSVTKNKNKKKTKTRGEGKAPKVKRDISANELYKGIRETLAMAGYQDECLLKSVCELAKHPLADSHDNVIYDVLHFVLTPSAHNGFSEEFGKEEEINFKMAEELGKSDGDCDLAYAECETSPLHLISNFI